MYSHGVGAESRRQARGGRPAAGAHLPEGELARCGPFRLCGGRGPHCHHDWQPTVVHRVEMPCAKHCEARRVDGPAPLLYLETVGRGLPPLAQRAPLVASAFSRAYL